MSTSFSSNGAGPDVGDSDGLIPLQVRFLNECAADPHGPVLVAQCLGIDPQLLARWHEQKAFVQRYRQIVRAVQRRREMTLVLLSSRAIDRLAESLEEKAVLDADQRRTCLELLKLARAARATRKPREKPPTIELPSELELEEKARLIARLSAPEEVAP